MIHARLSCILSVIVALFAADTLTAGDWPMWRNDTSRSGTSGAELPADLHLQWTRELPPPMPAWPNETRLHFDAGYEPIVLNSRMFVGSMVDGSVTAFDCETGEQLWRYYTNGPVRLAPVGFDNRVCFGSDDGWLYCVAADTGELIWKVSGAPADRERHLHLGNARIVSFWPVRGGPVVSDGVVYFGAGIWPTLGVFVRAVDAQNGRVIWTNDDSHAIADVRVDHNYEQESGISPQGHMLVSGDMLIVPNGRSMPARIDRKTGKLHYFVQGYRNGDSRVVVSGDIALVGHSGVVNLNDGREIANRWVAAGKDAPEGWSSPKVDLFEGPLFPYRFQPACDFRSAIDGHIAYGVDDGTVCAYDLKNATTSLQDKEFSGNKIKPARWDAKEVWTLKTEFTGKKLATRSLLKAGKRLYAHSGRHIFAVDLDSAQESPAAVAWTKELPSEPATMLAASDRLFVVTTEGAIHCFGSQKCEPQNFSLERSADSLPSDDWTALGKSIQNSASGPTGYAIVSGLRNGRLVEELMTKTEFHVIAVDDHAQIIDGLRDRFATDRKFQSRFQGIVDDPATIRLPPYLATLIVSEDIAKLQLQCRLENLYENLRPYGGTLCLQLSDTERRTLLTSTSTATFTTATIHETDELLTIRRTGPLPGSAVWSHETGDAARSFFSRDELVKAPLAVLWYGDGRDHGFYKRKDYGHGLKPQVAGGRLFALQVGTNTLKSVDAYTGRLLWSRKLGSSARYASMPDAVYVADERSCLVLDPATGESRHEFPLETDRDADVPVSASDIRVGDSVIVIAVRFNKENSIEKGRWNSELLIALDRTTGEQLWSRPANLRYNTAAIAVAGEKIFCIDSHSPEKIGLLSRRGKDIDNLSATVLCLDIRSGREIWKVVRDDPPAAMSSLHFMGLRTQDDWLSYSSEHQLVLAGRANRTFALNARTGDEVWQKPIRGQQPLILGPETFINQTGHTYDVSTGDVISGAALFRRGGCNYAVGGKNLLFLRSNCATYVDIETRQEYAIRNLRSGCSNSLVAADGLLNAPCFSVGCVCNYPIQTSFAMFHMPQSAAWHGSEPLKQER